MTDIFSLWQDNLYRAVTLIVKTIVVPSDTLFDFNSSDVNDVNAKGRADLAKLVTMLNENITTIKGISILGYADRIGSSQYNLALSQRRADTIKKILLNDGLNINPDSIITKGMGESNITNCSDSLPKTALVSCLSPDRRIEIQLSN